jgi:hypothetical protein
MLPKAPTPNPDPARISQPMWDFAHAVVALEPNDFVYAGSYTLKSGYHASVNDNKRHWPNDYSIRLAADNVGNLNITRGLDIKSKQAAAGSTPSIMAKYGARMRAAGKANDVRTNKWREVLGQFDTDKAAEAYDFQGDFDRVPDNTHEWHFHWSILTKYAEDPEAYAAMYSIMIGQSLTDYLKAGIMAFLDGDNGEALAWRVEALINGRDTVKGGPTKGEEVWLVKMLNTVVKSTTIPNPTPNPTSVLDAPTLATLLNSPEVQTALAAAVGKATVAGNYTINVAPAA